MIAPDSVEAESPEAARFLRGLRGILGVPKAELSTKIARTKAKKRNAQKATSKKQAKP